MIEIILTIVLWIIIGIGALYAFLNIFFIITSKEFRKEFWTETKRKVKEQKKKNSRPYESEYYKRTGCRNFLSRGNRKI